MGDLIWVGNTLLPRWFVFAVAIGGPVLLGVIVYAIVAIAKSMSQ